MIASKEKTKVPQGSGMGENGEDRFGTGVHARNNRNMRCFFLRSNSMDPLNKKNVHFLISSRFVFNTQDMRFVIPPANAKERYEKWAA